MTKRKPTYAQSLALQAGQAKRRAQQRAQALETARRAVEPPGGWPAPRDRCPDCGREKATNLAPVGYPMECPTFGYCAKR